MARKEATVAIVSSAKSRIVGEVATATSSTIRALSANAIGGKLLNTHGDRQHFKVHQEDLFTYLGTITGPGCVHQRVTNQRVGHRKPE